MDLKYLPQRAIGVLTFNPGFSQALCQLGLDVFTTFYYASLSLLLLMYLVLLASTTVKVVRGICGEQSLVKFLV